MRKQLLDILRCPETLEKIVHYGFKVEGENIIEGLIVGEKSKYAYPVIKGVPVMLKNAIAPDFIKSWDKELQEIEKEHGGIGIRSAKRRDDWSFSAEWAHHFEKGLTRTWGWEVEQRGQMFIMETNVTHGWFPGKLVLDAGCGNGHLSEHVSTFGATVIGLDYSDSVFLAEKMRKSETVHFIKADLQKPPFQPDIFDLVFSAGVLHHTTNTEFTFKKAAETVKEGGKFYLWLYEKPRGSWKRLILWPILDSLRYVTSRLPHFIQKPVIHLYARVFWLKNLLQARGILRNYSEMVTSAYDSLTPRWRHYHNPSEVACWFFEAGYSAPILTH